MTTHPMPGRSGAGHVFNIETVPPPARSPSRRWASPARRCRAGHYARPHVNVGRVRPWGRHEPCSRVRACRTRAQSGGTERGVPGDAARSAGQPSGAPLPAIEESTLPCSRRRRPSTNQWTPLTPGTQLVFDGQVLEYGVAVPHRVIIAVTDLTKEIDGVSAAVVLDRDFTTGTPGGGIGLRGAGRCRQRVEPGRVPRGVRERRFVGAPNTWLAGQATRCRAADAG